MAETIVNADCICSDRTQAGVDIYFSNDSRVLLRGVGLDGANDQFIVIPRQSLGVLWRKLADLDARLTGAPAAAN
jgi:hypothetical protein